MSFAFAASDARLENRVGTLGLRTGEGGGESDRSEPERGESGGETGAEDLCRPLRLLDELDELVEAVVWRGRPGGDRLDKLDEGTGNECMVGGANSDGGLTLDPPPFPVSIGGGRLTGGGFDPGGVLRSNDEGDLCVLGGAVGGGLPGVCGEDSDLGAEALDEVGAGAVVVFSLGAAKGESGVLFFGGPPPPP